MGSMEISEWDWENLVEIATILEWQTPADMKLQYKVSTLEVALEPMVFGSSQSKLWQGIDMWNLLV